jgi:catechol 2,3-dioxygenase-like lactoylglutathione lyase family enzyme
LKLVAELDSIDHVAIPVEDVASSVEWYRRSFQCNVTYQDATWALLEFNNMRLALVIPSQHPAHVGFMSPEAEKFGPLKTHRDGTRSIYIKDPSGNSVEILAADSIAR